MGMPTPPYLSPYYFIGDIFIKFDIGLYNSPIKHLGCQYGL